MARALVVEDDVTVREVCRRLRGAGDVPIVMLAALGSEQDRVVGLELGAGDYVTKPSGPRELVLRVDSARHEAVLGGVVLSLTGREFDLLRHLGARPGRTFSRDDLLREVGGWTVGDGSTVTVHVRRLREKVEVDPTRPVRLVTVWGVGYRWETA